VAANKPSAKIIGVATPRSEGREKVSGTAIYATDVVLPNMLWAKALRCPIAYGQIKKIDTSKAESLPGVRAVVTGADVKGLLIGRKIYDMPVLSDTVVRFIGEKVAAVAAETEEIAEAAAELIDVEYEEFSPLLDPLEAVKASAPLLHPDVQSYRGLLHEIKMPSNVFVEMAWTRATLKPGFEKRI
jgi:carbon-monoxide dehydrogenase large subunit